MAARAPDVTGAISARVVLRVVEFVASKGHDPEAFCRSVGLDMASLRSPEARLPYGLVARLTERAARVANDPNFGLHLAQSVPESVGHDAGLLMLLASPTTRAAFERMTRYQRFWGDGERTTLVPVRGGLCVRYTLPEALRETQRQADECAIAEVVVGVRALTARDVAPTAVRFRHRAPGDTSEHAALFRCATEFEATHTEVEFDDATLDAPLPEANATYCAIFERQVERALESIAGGRGLADEVRAVARATLAGGECSLRGTARALGISARTMQRRLQARGTSFGEVVDAVRRELAIERLREGVAVHEVAFMLGYSEPSAFHHAFKRWTGTTPERVRGRGASDDSLD